MSLNKTCWQCNCNFEITVGDLSFYKKVSPRIGDKTFEIPPPRLCPDCRQQRRLTFRNDRKIYKRKCDATGKEIVSAYSPDKKYPIYHQDYWWSDKWDPMKFGQDFDFNKPFFEQFGELLNKVPKPHIHMQSCENSDYGNFCWGNKNCYLVFASDRNENCLYGHLIVDCINCVDCSFSNKCQYSYELVNCTNCYESAFSDYCVNCDNIHYSLDLKNCSYCFGCAGLRNKKYYIFNKSVKKEEYEKEINSLFLENKIKEDVLQKINDLYMNHPRRFARLISCENCTGDDLIECNNCKDCFDAIGAEDCVRVQNSPGNTKDCHDVYAAGYGAELCYDSYCLAANNTSFSFLIYPTGADIVYSAYSGSSHHLFGCVGLQHKKYCILNKQYTKEEYENLVPKIIEHMIRNNEWGEFFPVGLSPFAYNETVAYDYFPLDKKEVLEKKWKWKKEEDVMPNVTRIIPAEKLPDKIQDVPDDILNWAIKCEKTGRLFRIQKLELEFYRKINLPIPHYHPDIRHENRFKKRNPRKLWKRKCDKCQVDIKTTYLPKREEKIYCEKCYLNNMN